VITAVADLATKGWIAFEPSRGRRRNNIDLIMPSNSAPIDGPLADPSNSARKDRLSCTVDAADGASQERQPCTVDAANGARQMAHAIEITTEKKHNREGNREENREENIKENGIEKRKIPYIPHKAPDSQIVEPSESYRPRHREPRQTQQPSVASEARFEEFWRAYPRKTSKGAARKAWAKAITKAVPDKIIAAVRRYAVGETARMTSGVNPGLRYTAYPATWLNAERWDDETTPNEITPQHRHPGERSIADLVAGSLGVKRRPQ
jgi:hypothetical protein